MAYRQKKSGIVLTAVLSSLITAFLFTFTFYGFFNENAVRKPITDDVRDEIDEAIPKNTPSIPQPQQIEFTQQTMPSATIPEVVRTAIPAVVGIAVLKADGDSIFDGNTTEKWGMGSGAIVDPNGYILTNDHVAGGKNRKIIVTLENGKTVEGVTLWSDPVIDLAVVKVNLTGLPTIALGDASTLQVGETAIAIGNPLGLQFQRTVTSGIISALNRTIKVDTPKGPNFMEDLIQTDASINPGNSGGPLLNMRGEIIGINTVKVSSAEGIGFAIPINLAKPIIESFSKTGTFDEPYLGVFAYDKEVMPYVNPNIQIERGVYVASIDSSGPAAKGGCKVGHIIMEVDGKEINTMVDLRTAIYGKKVGDTVKLTCSDGKGNTHYTMVKLAAKQKDWSITR